MPARTRRAPKTAVNVTADIIDSAIRHSSGHCMISAAIQNGIPAAAYISTDLQTIRWTNLQKRERYIYLTPPVAQQALIKFDQGNENIQPFTFKLYQGQVTNMRADRTNNRKRLVPADNASAPSQLQVTAGKPPPLAALASGSGAGRKSLLGPLSAGYLNEHPNRRDDDTKIGRRRRFGLRALKE